MYLMTYPYDSIVKSDKSEFLVSPSEGIAF